MLLEYIIIGRLHWENSNLHASLSLSGWLTHLAEGMLVSLEKCSGTLMLLSGAKKSRIRCHSGSPCGPLSPHPQQTPAEKIRSFWEQRMHWAVHKPVAEVMGTYGGFNHI